MKKRLMSTLLMGAFFLASTSMFVSCKDYDDDINANTKAIQNVENALAAQKTALENAIAQSKTEYTAANTELNNAIKNAQAAADAAHASLQQAIADANSNHATKTELNAVNNVVSTKASVDELNTAIANLRTELNKAISDGDASSQAALTAAIEKVNTALDGVKGDIATVKAAQTEISSTLTSAINTVDTKATNNAASIQALQSALAGVQQSMQTKEAVQNAIDIAKGEIATNIQAVQAAAEKAQSDATSAKADLATLAEKVSTAAAAQAAAETKIEALQKAVEACEALEKTLQSGISANAADIKVINNQIATLDAQIKSVNENLSTLIAANTNTIQDLAGTVGNIGLQVAALEKFCGNLDALNVAGIRDSMRLSFVELKAAQAAAAQALADAEVRSALTAAGFVAALEEQLTERIDSLKDNYATAEELAQAEQAAKDYAKGYVDALNVPALQATVDKLTSDLGDSSIADILDNLDWVNNTLTWSESGEVINLEQELNAINGTLDVIDEWAADINEFVADVENNVKGYQNADEVQALIDKAIKDKDGKDKYVALNQLNALLSDVAMAEAYKAAGVALTTDLAPYAKSADLDAYLKKADISLEGLAVSPADAKAIAEKAIEDASLATKQELADAIKDYDADLAASLEKLFDAVKPVKEDANTDDEAAEKTAAQLIEEIAAAYKAEGGVSPAVVDKINVLRIQLQQQLTSLVFYPEAYYAGIEAIEITAMKIVNTWKLSKTGDAGKEVEAYTYNNPTTAGEFNVYPSGYAKYHINPVNADLSDYTLAFIDHVAKTRSESEPMLTPKESAADKNYRDGNDVLWVEFENSPEIYGRINEVTNIPSMAHNASANMGYSHYTYGSGDEAQTGIITALTATKNSVEEGENSYVASDYALIVPVTINRLVLVSATQTDLINTIEYAGQGLKNSSEVGINHNYNCIENHHFHLYTIAKDRTQDYVWNGAKRVQSDNFAIDALKYDEEFDLTELVETHYMNSESNSANDQKVDDDLFKRLNLAYRFTPIDYTRGDNKTSESVFITLTGKDESGKYFNGKGYFNQVIEKNGVGQKRIDETTNEPMLANDACLGRQPVVRVELYRKDNPELTYAVGYLKLEIAKDVKRKTETIDYTMRGSLKADCKSGSDKLSLVWDQIQTKLNDLKDGQGLSPEAWNTYKFAGVENEDGSVTAYQYVDDDADPETDPVLISKPYSMGNADASKNYPYFTIGSFKIDEDTNAQGKHTNCITWYISSVDYTNIYYDLQMRSLDPAYINTKTGVYLKDITRYVKLISSDSANPDLFVGLTIPAEGGLTYGVGTMGKTIGGWWKSAASNSAGDVDIVLNVDLQSDLKNANHAELSDDVDAGVFTRNLMTEMYGEELVINVTNGVGTNLAKSYASEAEFYFRTPSSLREKEKVFTVDAKGQWKVKGISGREYTLAVTDQVAFEVANESGKNLSEEGKPETYYYAGYGKSISITNGVNDKTPGAVKYYRGYGEAFWGLPIMTIDDDHNITLLSNANVKGYTQDMLNYARHNEQSDGTFSTATDAERPYNKQLTAFIILMSDEGDLVSPSMSYFSVGSSANDGDYSAGQTTGMSGCYIIPYQNCNDCGDEEKLNTETLKHPVYKTSKFCYIPFIEDNMYAVRFYKPVSIVAKSSAFPVRDAQLTSQVWQTVSYAKLFDLIDWANYTAGPDFRNFVRYYGVKVGINEQALSSYYQENTSAAAELVTDKAEALGGVPVSAYTLADGVNKTFANYKSAIIAAAKAAEQDATTYVVPAVGQLWNANPFAKYTDGKYTDGTDWTTTAMTEDDFKGYKATTSTDATDAEKADWAARKAGYEFMVTNGVYAKNYQYYEKPRTPNLWSVTAAEDGDGNVIYSEVYPKPLNYTFAYGKTLTVQANGTINNGTTTSTTDLTATDYYVVVDPDYAVDGSDFKYKYRTQPKRSDFDSDADFTTADASYKEYKFNKDAFDAYYGDPQENPDYVPADEDALVDNRTKAQRAMYLYDAAAWTNYPDIDGDLTHYLAESTTPSTIKDRSWANIEKISQHRIYGKKSGTLASYYTALDTYGTRLLAWEAIDKTSDKAVTGATVSPAAYLAAKMQWLLTFNVKWTADVENPDNKSGLNADDVWANWLEYQDNPRKLSDAGKSYEQNLEVIDRYAKATADPSGLWYNQVKADDEKKDANGNDVDELIDALVNALLARDANEALGNNYDAMAVKWIRDNCRTDLGETNRTYLKDNFAAIEKLPTVNTVSPTRLQFELDFVKKYVTVAPELGQDANGALTGGFGFKYTNTGNNTNEAFHIYIPLEVTYSYANQSPAAPIRFWACIEVNSTQGNTNARTK